MTPTQLLNSLNTLGKSKIFFGPQGFEIALTEAALMNAQHGFSMKPDNTPLPSEEAANWQSNWIVIATDTELGDPYFIDVLQEKSPIYTAMITDNGWQAEVVAASLMQFIQCLQLLDTTSQQQQAQFIPENSTITDKRQLAQLKNKLIKLAENEKFWTLFFDCYLDWLEDLDE